jgi:SAM-dependent methyltransferase
MLRQFVHRNARIVRGIRNSRFRGRAAPYDDRKWWDETFYADGVSDRQTLSVKKSLVAAKYHYCSVELRILRHLSGFGIDVSGSAVLELGAGAGHWIDFYRSLGSGCTIALDVSRLSVEYLRAKYAANPDVTIVHGNAPSAIAGLVESFDIVNAIGVMFHIVDDSEWLETIRICARLLSPKGILVTTGNFGFVDGVNVQVDRHNCVNKRLRSKRRWKRALESAGFTDVRIYRNYAYLWIREVLPENHVLIATK